MVKVSVIMPVYNDEIHLSESINSVLNQILKDIEIICVNDGSSDNSLKILNDYSDKFDFIKVFSKENGGSGSARNLALTNASGEYVAYLDADDIFVDENALEYMYDAAIRHDAYMVSANLKGITSKGDLVNNENLSRFKSEKIIVPEEYGIPWSFYKNMFKREFLIKNQISFPDLLRGQDPVFLAEILVNLNEIVAVPVDLYGYRYPEKSSLLKMNTFEKKSDYVQHFKDTFQILDNANFKLMRKEYEKRLFEFIEAFHNSYSKELKDIVFDIFSQDKDILDKASEIFVKPKVSVVIPIYNAEKFLKESIPCILNQSLKEIELICINDGSTDNSLEILKEFSLNDSRIRIINQENAGCGAARNRGIDEIYGDYCYFFDPDDYLVPEALEKLYNNACSNGSDLVLFKLAFWVQGKPIDYSKPHFDLDNHFKNVDFNSFTFNYSDIKKYVMNSKAFAPWFKLYRTEFLKEYDDFYFPVGLPFDDVPFHVMSLLRAKKMSFVPEFFYHYRIDNPDSVNSNPKNCMGILDIINIVEDFLRKENFFNEFVYEFFNFKIFHTSIYIFRSDDSEWYFQTIKNEYLLIKEYFIENGLDFNKISKNSRKFLNEIVDSDSFTEFELRKKVESLESKNKKLRKEYKKVKKLNNELINSNSWKLTAPLRKIKNLK